MGATCLVNMTNDGIFGRTPASYYPLINVVPCAIENRRPLLRCANSGISCMVSATVGSSAG